MTSTLISFRATFEDKILRSDLVLLTAETLPPTLTLALALALTLTLTLTLALTLALALTLTLTGAAQGVGAAAHPYFLQPGRIASRAARR